MKIKKIKDYGKIWVSSIYSKEEFLETGKTEPNSFRERERERIVREYKLEKKGTSYYGSKKHVFDVLREKYPEAASKYRSYWDLNLAVLNCIDREENWMSQ